MQINVHEYISVARHANSTTIRVMTEVTNGQCGPLNLQIYDESELNAYFYQEKKIDSGELILQITVMISEAFDEIGKTIADEIELQQEALRRLEDLGVGIEIPQNQDDDFDDDEW